MHGNPHLKLSKRLSFYRKSLDLTQKELSVRCGRHMNYIQRVEAGNRRTSTESLIRICRCLGVSTTHLLGV